MNCLRCGAHVLASEPCCSCCGPYDDPTFEALMTLRRPHARMCKLVGLVAVGGGIALATIAVGVLFKASIWGALAVAMLAKAVGSEGAAQLEEARPYRQLRHINDDNVARVRRTQIRGAGPSTPTGV